MVQTYLSSIIDDHSRYILASEFYDNQEKTIVEDTFHKAILKHGRFDAGYVDNGKQYVSRQLLRSLSKLGIRMIHARPYSGQSKGKILSAVFYYPHILRRYTIFKDSPLEICG